LSLATLFGQEKIVCESSYASHNVLTARIVVSMDYVPGGKFSTKKSFECAGNNVKLLLVAQSYQFTVQDLLYIEDL
jgi:hypothetical protein